MQHIEGEFRENSNFNLYYQCWLPADLPRAALLLVHGLAEHSGRYLNFANYFAGKGYAVYCFDQRGHGKSPGLRGYIDKFSDFVDDLDTFLEVIRNKHRNTKIFLIGHSLGGTISVAYGVLNQDKLNGLILSGATLRAGASISSGIIILGRVLSLILPKIGLYTIDTSALSRDKTVVDTYVNDPLVYLGKVRIRLGIEILKIMRTLESQMLGITLPILIMHGTADQLSDPKGSEILYNKVSSRDKTLKLYDGFYHEIFNEFGHARVFTDIEGWLTAHV
ncbi:alpha/beta hydrolase [Chloroflexota bacterium]